LDFFPVAPGGGDADLFFVGVVEYELAAGVPLELTFVEALDAVFDFSSALFGAEWTATGANRLFVEIILVANTLAVFDFVLFLFWDRSRETFWFDRNKLRAI